MDSKFVRTSAGQKRLLFLVLLAMDIQLDLLTLAKVVLLEVS